MGRAARAAAQRKRGEGQRIHLANPAADDFARHVAENAEYCTAVVEPGVARGQHLVLCGAGPSLAETIAYCADGDQVWATNGALPWLIANGHRVTHGFTVNQFAAMTALWSPAPDVEYMLASTVDPALSALVYIAGRPATYFHNAVLLPEQDELYAKLYPPTICAGSGLNAVTRALDVADFMGFERITVLGADCCLRVPPGHPPRSSVTAAAGSAEYMNWLAGTIMHVNGENPIDGGCPPLTLSGVIDGREWVGQADLWITMQWLVRMAKASNGKIRVIGDGLATAMMDKPTAFLDRLPMQVWDSTGKIVKIPF